MNSAANSQAPGFLKKSWNALNSALIVALIIAVGGWAFQYRETRLAATQTFNMERLAELSADGAKLDKSVVEFFDAAAQGDDLRRSRKKVVAAIVDHSLKVESLRSVMGDASSDEYLRALNDLSEQVAATKDATHAGQNITALAKMIETRRALVKRVRNQA